MDRKSATEWESSCGLLIFNCIDDDLERIGCDDDFCIRRDRDVVRVGDFQSDWKFTCFVGGSRKLSGGSAKPGSIRQCSGDRPFVGRFSAGCCERKIDLLFEFSGEVLGGLRCNGKVVRRDAHLRLQGGFIAKGVAALQRDRVGSGRRGFARNFADESGNRGGKAFGKSGVRRRFEGVRRNTSRKGNLPIIRETCGASWRFGGFWREAQGIGGDNDCRIRCG